MSLLEEEKNFFFPVFKRFPIEVERGEGAYLIDKNGGKYLDFLAGIAVNALGYAHPAILQAINTQSSRNLHLSNYFVQDVQMELAKKLLSLTPFSRLFFTNSGTEAIEGLLKLVRKFGKMSGKDEIIAFSGSFHGRSLGALSLTMQEKYQKNFVPLLPGIRRVPFNDVNAFNASISDKTAGVFFEGLAGEGGIRPISKDMLSAISDGKDRFGYLTIMDEIQTGIGRTGTFYYFEHTGMEPDAIASAKGLGGGLPLGAFLVKDELKDIFDIGEHGTTYGGNPLACATGLATVDIISSEKFLKEIAAKGDYFKSKLLELKQEFDEYVTEVRGLGLMLGIEINQHVNEVLKNSLQNGLIFNIAGGNTLRLIPPLIVTYKEIDEAYDKLFTAFKQTFK